MESSSSLLSALFDGNGTAENPYIITTAEELAGLANAINSEVLPYTEAGIWYRLDSDIDLAAYLSVNGAGYNNGRGWTPIGTDGIGKPMYNRKAFKGIFDGNNHIISNLYINNTVLEYYIGLFGMLMGGVIKNLGIVNADVTGIYDVACIAGYIDGASRIENCFALGKVAGDLYVGGLVGCIGPGSVVDRCYCTAAVGGNNYVGGIAGSIGNGVMPFYIVYDGGKILNCAALNSSVRSEGQGRNGLFKTEFHPYVGRVTGYLLDGCQLYNNVAFSGMRRDGGIAFAGRHNDYSMGGASITPAQIREDGTMGGRFIPQNGWVIHNGYLPNWGTVIDLPEHLSGNIIFAGDGTVDNPYLIGTAEELDELSILINNEVPPYADKGICYKLTNDIDLTSYLSVGGKGYNRGWGWIPIGSGGNYDDVRYYARKVFRGVFDGNNKVITGIYINKDSSNTCPHSAGLFGTLLGGVVKNLGVKNTDIVGHTYVGGIAGYIDGASKILNSYVDGKIAGEQFIGGVVGIAGPGCLVESCYSTAVISGINNLAGIVGFIVNGEYLMENVYSVCQIKNCAALNPRLQIITTKNVKAINVSKVIVARVAITSFKDSLVNNVAYSNMKAPPGVKFIGSYTADGLNGESVTAKQIAMDSTLGGRVTSITIHDDLIAEK